MYPLHLNYTTTLPCETITMNIIIFQKGTYWNTWIIIVSLAKCDVINSSKQINIKLLIFRKFFNIFVNWCLEWWVKFPCTIKWKSRHCVRKDWDVKKTFELVWKLGTDTLNTPSNKLFSQGFELLASCDGLKCQILLFSFDFNTSAVIKIENFIVIHLHGSVLYS